jgi:poly-gamma-glutamate capsule biosynthesis protein CapA/YwtB (metallophosphatase superfamily)
LDSIACDTAYVEVALADTIACDTAYTEPGLTDTICVIGTGDIMPGTNYPDNRYLPPGGCAKLFNPVSDILQSGDLTFGNLEGVFSSNGGTAKKCNNPKTCYVFRMPDEYLNCVLDAGYDVLSVANNHVNDFGYQGRINTYNLLEESGVPFAGFVTKPSTIFEKDGVIYGFAAFAPHSGTANLKDYEAAAKVVAALEDSCDIVIVSFHGGAEGKDYQHIPCTDEVYLGYNRGNACTFAHAVVDAGADIVFGHGPHVTRAMELYNDRLICYSLGNFCTYARFNLSGPNGLAPIVKVNVSGRGEFLDGEIIPVYQVGEGGPRPDPQKRVITKMQELIKADFPDGFLKVDDRGIIRKK